MLLELLGTFVLSLVSLYIWLVRGQPIGWVLIAFSTFYDQRSSFASCSMFLVWRHYQHCLACLYFAVHRGHWLLGTMVDFPKSGDGIWQGMQRRRKQLGPVHEVRLMWMQQVQLYGPEEIKVLAQSNTNLSKCSPSSFAHHLPHLLTQLPSMDRYYLGSARVYFLPPARGGNRSGASLRLHSTLRSFRTTPRLTSSKPACSWIRCTCHCTSYLYLQTTVMLRRLLGKMRCLVACL